MVSIPSPMQNYVMLWGISLGSSVGLMVIAAALYLITGSDAGVTGLFILMFNATATSFILLTMIPVGIFILIFGVVFNGLAPLLAPIGAALWNFGAEFIIGIVNSIPLLGIDINFLPIQFVTTVNPNITSYIQLSVPTIDVESAILATTNFLLALQGFLIDQATGGTSDSGVFIPNLITAKLWG